MTDTPDTADTPAAASPDVSDYPLLARPQVLLHGPVNDAMYDSFRAQLLAAEGDDPLVVSITSLGGDPEVGRAMGDDIRLLRDLTGREALFLGKVAVYSAAATFMASFPADKRFLTRRTRLMLHERWMTSTIQLSGPLTTLSAVLTAKLNEIADSIHIQEEGFARLVEGTKVSLDELREKATANWYIEAEEARALGLVLDVI